ncbi:hypothetical protein Hanom_Chr03g00183251 [Helianthus anomalus]
MSIKKKTLHVSTLIIPLILYTYSPETGHRRSNIKPIGEIRSETRSNSRVIHRIMKRLRFTRQHSELPRLLVSKLHRRYSRFNRIGTRIGARSG